MTAKMTRERLRQIDGVFGERNPYVPGNLHGMVRELLSELRRRFDEDDKIAADAERAAEEVAKRLGHEPTKQTLGGRFLEHCGITIDPAYVAKVREQAAEAERAAVWAARSYGEEAVRTTFTVETPVRCSVSLRMKWGAEAAKGDDGDNLAPIGIKHGFSVADVKNIETAIVEAFLAGRRSR